MRFKVDENLPFEAALLLRVEGYAARTVTEQRARGASDSEIAAMCSEQGESLVTLDLDFADSHTYPPEQYPRFVVLRPDVQSEGHVLDLLRASLKTLRELSLEQHLTIVDSRSIRYYPGD